MGTGLADAVIAWCQPVRSKIDPLTFQCYRMLDRSGLKGWHHIEVVGQPVAVARNMITVEALADPTITHLFWVDSDMVYGPETLKRLLSYDLPLIGGLCFDRRPPFKPVIARAMDPAWGYDPGTLGWLYDYPPEARIEVDATGGAFLLARREVFEAIREQDGETWWTPLPEHQQAEDLSLCARAKRAGFRIVVDTGCRVGHVAGEGIVVDEEFARKNRIFEAHRYNPIWSPLDSRETHEKKSPIATIVIPTYNTPTSYLEGAIESALGQTVPVEVIVVDDGSAEAPKVPLSVSIVFRHRENRGIAAALNTGIAHMTTEWFCWLSADDLLEPHKVECQLDALLAVGAKAGCHNYNVQRDNGATVGRAMPPSWRTIAEQRAMLSRACLVNGSTVMIHKDVLEATRLSPGVYFDPAFKYGQDWEMWCRVGQEHYIHVQREILGTRREFGNLTERILASKDLDLRKRTEDAVIMERYSARCSCGRNKEGWVSA